MGLKYYDKKNIMCSRDPEKFQFLVAIDSSLQNPQQFEDEFISLTFQ